MADFSPLVHKLPTTAKNDIRARRTIKVQRPSCGRYWAYSSQIAFVVTLYDFRGEKSRWGALQTPKFTPDKNFEANASSSLALAFHFIFDELSTPSRSKIVAIPAKSSNTGVLPGVSKFLKNIQDPPWPLGHTRFRHFHHNQA